MLCETAAGESNCGDIGGTEGEECGLRDGEVRMGDKQMKNARNKAAVKKQAANWKKPKGMRKVMK